MTKEQMMDKVIRKFGFEADETLDFCLFCIQLGGNPTMKQIKARYNELMER
jgi:hypothetical protein